MKRIECSKQHSHCEMLTSFKREERNGRTRINLVTINWPFQ